MSIYIKALNRAAILCVAVIIFSLFGWIYYQSNKIDGLNARLIEQNQIIEQQQQANQQLKDNLAQERQAVEIARKTANELKQKVEIARNEIKSILAKDECANTVLPVGVADSIKRLHQQNNHKH